MLRWHGDCVDQFGINFNSKGVVVKLRMYCYIKYKDNSSRI